MREPRWVMESAKAKALAERERSELRGVCLLSSSEEIHHASEQV